MRGRGSRRPLRLVPVGARRSAAAGRGLLAVRRPVRVGDVLLRVAGRRTHDPVRPAAPVLADPRRVRRRLRRRRMGPGGDRAGRALLDGRADRRRGRPDRRPGPRLHGAHRRGADLSDPAPVDPRAAVLPARPGDRGDGCRRVRPLLGPAPLLGRPWRADRRPALGVGRPGGGDDDGVRGGPAVPQRRRAVPLAHRCPRPRRRRGGGRRPCARPGTGPRRPARRDLHDDRVCACAADDRRMVPVPVGHRRPAPRSHPQAPVQPPALPRAGGHLPAAA